MIRLLLCRRTRARPVGFSRLGWAGLGTHLPPPRAGRQARLYAPDSPAFQLSAPHELLQQILKTLAAHIPLPVWPVCGVSKTPAKVVHQTARVESRVFACVISAAQRRRRRNVSARTPLTPGGSAGQSSADVRARLLCDDFISPFHFDFEWFECCFLCRARTHSVAICLCAFTYADRCIFGGRAVRAEDAAEDTHKHVERVGTRRVSSVFGHLLSSLCLRPSNVYFMQIGGGVKTGAPLASVCVCTCGNAIAFLVLFNAVVCGARAIRRIIACV